VARKLADFRYMEFKFPSFAISKSLALSYRLDNQLLSQYGLDQRSSEGESDVEYIEEEETDDSINNEEDNDNDSINEHEENIVIKSDTSKLIRD
jgi:hypothetical protein